MLLVLFTNKEGEKSDKVEKDPEGSDEDELQVSLWKEIPRNCSTVFKHIYVSYLVYVFYHTSRWPMVKTIGIWKTTMVSTIMPPITVKSCIYLYYYFATCHTCYTNVNPSIFSSSF